MMNDIQFANFIKNKGYRTSNQFNNTPQSLRRLIKFVKQLPVQKQSFQIIEGLLKFYRTPIFITCQPFYQRLAKSDKKILSQFEQIIKQIANFVKNYLQEYNLQQLKFFYLLGTLKKKKKLPDKSDNEKQFIKYIQKLGNKIKNLKLEVNTMSPQKLKNQIDNILSEGLDRKLNIFQDNYQKYFIKQVDKLYKEHLKQFQQQSSTNEVSKSLEQRPQYQPQKKTFICCRTFFYDQQIIKQPENLVLQYKNYYLPFGQSQIKILKKTICGFLNTNGGTIFLGIQQNVDNKKRRVLGNQLNEADKQNLMFLLRKQVVDSISPDILTNKMYWVNFVPVKQKNSPYHYIAGRYVTKITIKYGLRNEIYSYRSEDRDYFAFRTENQVIHRQGRQILNAYRQRLKNPLPIPIPVHQGPCVLPQQGRPITFDRIRKQEFFEVNNNSSQKKKFKQKDAIDFIIMGINQAELTKQFSTMHLSHSVTITYQSKQKVCFVKVVQNQKRGDIIQLLIKMESNNLCQLYQTQRGIQISKQEKLIDKMFQLLKTNNIKCILNEKKGKNVIEFKTTQQAMQAFLILRPINAKINFIGV